MKHLYATDRAGYVKCTTRDGIEYEIKCENVTHRNVGWKLSILWNVATFGNVKRYAIDDPEGKTIHSSLVVRGKAKFPFMKEKDIEIGPCETDPAYRGKNIYPYVLSYIIEKELDDEGVAYMIVEDSNTPSIRGITKAGFKPTGDVITVNLLKQYNIEK